MTPEAVIFRYLEAAHRQPLSVEAFVRVLSADADLLARWLTLTNCPAEPEALLRAVGEISAEDVLSLAQAQAWAVLPVAGSARLGLDQWQAVLRSAFLAEVLAEQLGLDDPVAVRWRVLLAISGVTLDHDPALKELATFRGARPELLSDASPLVRIFGVVDAFEVHDEFATAQLARTLLAIEAEHFSELVEWAASRSSELARALDLAADPEADWSNRLWVQQQVSMLAALLALAEDHEALNRAHEFITRSLFRRVPLLLLETEAGRYRSLHEPELVIPVDSETSQIAASIRSGERREIRESTDLSVGDRQLLGRMGVTAAHSLPVRANGHTLASLIMVSDDDVDYEFALTLYVDALAQRLSTLGASSSELDLLKKYRQREEKRLRELVHEVNNPMSVVQNYLHILKLRLQHDASASEQLEMIAAELSRATEIVQHARDLPPLTEVDADASVVVADFDVSSLARRVHELHIGYAADHEVDLELDLPDGLLTLKSDEQRLAQILNNLVRNAIEAATGESVTLGAKGGVFREGREGLEVYVSDTGPGLPRSVLERLGDPQESSKGGDHAGLGLHIVHRLVAELGGNIDVRTAAGQGTSFTLFLPLVL